MAFSFPDTVSPATQFSETAKRLNPSSSAKSQVASTDDEHGSCAAQKSRKLTDEDFDAVLAWMITGNVPLVQSPAAAESRDLPWTTDSAVTDAAETAVSTGFGPATVQIGTTSTGIGFTTAESQGVLPPSSAFPENTPTVSASQIHASSISPLPVSVLTVDAKPGSEIPRSEPPISTALSSVLTESNELKTPVPTPSVTTASARAQQATNTSVTSTSLTSGSEKEATGRIKPSFEVTSDHALASSSTAVVRPSSVADALKMIESMNQPVRGRTSSASARPVLDKSEFAIGLDPHAAAPSYDFVHSDMLQSNATNSLPDPAASISSETRPPLSNQVSHAIMEHIERNGVRSNDTLSVRLDPPELGEMTIELSKTNEGLAVRVTAREAVTMDMLFARGQEIESHLRGQQMNLKSLEFLRADRSANQFSQGQQQSDASRRFENLMSQVRRGSRNSIPANTNVGRITTSDSIHGLSFRA